MDSTHHFDIAIIGGGLAGLCSSILLKRAGCSVILFEKEAYPFHKVCGEYISMESWNFIQSLGVPLSQWNLPRINQLKVSAPNGHFLKHNLSLGGFGISRYKLDAELAAIARKEGVVLIENIKVNDINHHQILTNHGQFKAQYIVGAWGKRSKMDTSLMRNFLRPVNRKLNDYVGVKYHVQANLPSNTIELHNFRNGYCGISQIEDEKYCMCYLVKGVELKKAGGNIRKMEKELLMKNPFLKEYFTNFPSLYDQPLSIAQISFEQKSQLEGEIMMIGDTAGLITPLTGNGMSMAMKSAYLLSYELINVTNGNQDYESAKHNYITNWNKEFAGRLKTGRLIQSMFGNTTMTNLFLGALRPFPSLIDKLVQSTHGQPF